MSLSLTVVHERLQGPQLHVDHKTAVVAGNVWVQELLREFHLVLHLLQFLGAQHLQVHQPEDGVELMGLVPRYEDGRCSETAHSWEGGVRERRGRKGEGEGER